ncbi:MAG: PD-(D/E)XK nuclease family protein, partial [Bacteroidales bacterium]|nr:PD-(D/E)XK nuclease family protein [Bacteroidales bacterium]
MKETFISLVVKHLLQVTHGDLKDVAVIFPNLRSGNIFRKELTRQVATPTWSPGIFSIDDWLVNLSGLEKTGRLTELALLFQVVKQELPHIESFSDYLDLGEILLTDFDDTDKYLADPLQLFTALNETKKIDNQFDITSDEELAERIRIFWSSFGAGRSSHQEKWLKTWEKLYVIYDHFHRILEEQGLGTSGMCYRKAAGDLISGKVTTGRYKKVVFVGFNILTAAEEAIFSFLRDQRTAIFYWDYHPFYLESPHEAGKFIRQYLKMFPSAAGFQPFAEQSENFFQSTRPEDVIHVVPVTSNTGQIQALLNDILERPAVNRSIILSDEGLFSDLLSSWPDETMPVNFTSGYPLRDTQAAGLFANLTDIYLEFNQTAGQQVCKSERLLTFLHHPWAKWLIGGESDSLIRIIQRRYPDTVPAAFIEEQKGLSEWVATSQPALVFIRQLYDTGIRLLSFESLYGDIEKASIQSYIAESVALSEVINKFGLIPDARSLSKLLSRFVSAEKISIETDRTALNQVTGILETRLVDFDEVFILSFNEGIWPSKSLPGSLIPYSLRRLFHLPTAENRDAMYAYYFYRLIQRTTGLYIYYLTGHRDDVIRSGEKSRYITQLQFEIPGKVETRMEPPARVGNPANPIVVRKEGGVQERLSRYLSGSSEAKWLSPSAINEYMECGLRFALKRIYDIKEPDYIAYAAEPKGFGVLIHQVMNRLYQEFVGLDYGPDRKWLQGILDEQDRLRKIILEEYSMALKEPGGVKPGGKDLLAIEVVRQFLNKILEFDQTNLPFKVAGLEQKFN